MSPAMVLLPVYEYQPVTAETYQAGDLGKASSRHQETPGY